MPKQKLAVLAAVVGLTAGACHTRTQAWTMTGVGVGSVGLGVYVVHSVRHDDEADAALPAIALLVLGGGLTALVSAIDALSYGSDPAPPQQTLPRAAREACLRQRAEILRRAGTRASPRERADILATQPDCGAPPSEAQRAREQQDDARERAWTLTKAATEAAHANDCDTVRRIGGEVRALDLDFHDTVFLRNVGFARCEPPP